MTENKGGPTADPGGGSEPGQEERGREFSETGGHSAEKGETPPADDQAAIDLDTAHDRAS
jgi:hypothetical protein